MQSRKYFRGDGHSIIIYILRIKKVIRVNHKVKKLNGNANIKIV